MSTSVCKFVYLSTYCLFKDTFNTGNNKMIIEYVWTSCTSYSVNTILDAILGCFLSSLVIYIWKVKERQPWDGCLCINV